MGPRLLQVVYGARRRAGGATDRIARRMARLRRHPFTGLPSVTCDYFAVPDGRTLQLHAMLPGLSAGPEYRAELVLAGQRGAVTHPAVIRADRAGGYAVEALVPLGHGPGELPLATGTWAMAVRITAPDKPEQRYALRVAELVDPPGPTVADPPHPVSGHRYRPARDARGIAQLTVTGPPARAEVVRLTTDHLGARIRARLIGVDSTGAHPTVVFSPRGGGADVVVPIDLADGAFEVLVPLAELATGRPGREVVWEVWARPSTARMIRVGRYLHDLRNPQPVLSVSREILPLGGDDFVGYRPYYTATGNLAVACLRFTRFTGMPS